MIKKSILLLAGFYLLGLILSFFILKETACQNACYPNAVCGNSMTLQSVFEASIPIFIWTGLLPTFSLGLINYILRRLFKQKINVISFVVIYFIIYRMWFYSNMGFISGLCENASHERVVINRFVLNNPFNR